MSCTPLPKAAKPVWATQLTTCINFDSTALPRGIRQISICDKLYVRVFKRALSIRAPFRRYAGWVVWCTSNTESPVNSVSAGHTYHITLMWIIRSMYSGEISVEHGQYGLIFTVIQECFDHWHLPVLQKIHPLTYTFVIYATFWKVTVQQAFRCKQFPDLTFLVWGHRYLLHVKAANENRDNTARTIIYQWIVREL